MDVWAIIPVKPFGEAKTRLASALLPSERERLASVWFRHVLYVAQTTPSITETLVVSRDERALALARDHGARTLRESGVGLNAAFTQATAEARRHADAVLLLPADLPLLHVDDLATMIGLAESPLDSGSITDPLSERSLIIAADRKDDGTNAMLVCPPGLIAYSYGVGSFGRHVAAAEAVGARVAVYRSPRLMLDIDVPDDLALYYRQLEMV
jgi:2-phospho-L-lactate guanylyltransferase